MKNWGMLVLMMILVILTACGTSDDSLDETEKNTSEETVSEPAEEPVEDTVQPDKPESTEEANDSSADEMNYTAAENCIMTQLEECKNVSEADQFQAYNDLVSAGTLPQAPGSGCLSCAVKYSFEAKYGESDQINSSALPRSIEAPDEISNVTQFIQQYLFSLPAYFNDHNEEALRFFQPDSPGYNNLFSNKASGTYSNHMTYSVFINSEVDNPDGSINIYAYRTYSHANTNGIFETYVRYNVIEADNRYYITDYKELENTRIE